MARDDVLEEERQGASVRRGGLDQTVALREAVARGGLEERRLMARAAHAAATGTPGISHWTADISSALHSQSAASHCQLSGSQPINGLSFEGVCQLSASQPTSESERR